MEISVRTAVPADFPVIFSLLKEFSVFQKTPEKVFITLPEMMQEASLFRCLVAETAHSEIIGFASYFFAWYSWSGKAIYLDDLYVKEAYRQQAVGKSLLEAVIGIAKSERCKKVRWQVSSWNANAIAFYKNIGAKIDDTEMNCDLWLNEP